MKPSINAFWKSCLPSVESKPMQVLGRGLLKKEGIAFGAGSEDAVDGGTGGSRSVCGDRRSWPVLPDTIVASVRSWVVCRGANVLGLNGLREYLDAIRSAVETVITDLEGSMYGRKCTGIGWGS